MNALRTENDLRAALVELSQDPPTPSEVLPERPELRPRRRLPRWLAPAAAAAIAAAVAIAASMLGHGAARPPAAAGHLGALVGVQWQLRAVGDRPATLPLVLQIEPNGRFSQNLGQCASLDGRALLATTQIKVQRVRRSLGLCPAIPSAARPSPAQRRRAAATANVLGRTLRDTLSWTVADGRLMLFRPGAPALTYTRSPHSPVQTRQWTFHGVGITVPRAWPKNALRCGTPTADTVVYPGPVATCAFGRPRDVTAVELLPTRHGHDVLASEPGEFANILIDGVPARERNGHPSTGPYSGLEVIEVQVPSHDASIVISAPNGAEAAQLSEAIYIVGN